MRILNTEFWAKQRSKGWRHFVFVTGIFQVALPTVLLGLLFSWFWVNRSGLTDQVPGLTQRFLLAGVFGVFLGVPALGILWGLVTWRINEWLYRRYTAGTSPGA